jgi:hypothetical protein
MEIVILWKLPDTANTFYFVFPSRSMNIISVTVLSDSFFLLCVIDISTLNKTYLIWSQFDIKCNKILNP